MTIAAVDVEGLASVIWVSLLAGVGITVVFSFIVVGSERSAAARRDGRGADAATYAVIAGLAFALFLAGVIFGVNVMLSKD